MSAVALAGGVALYALLEAHVPGLAGFVAPRRMNSRRIVVRAFDASARFLLDLLGTHRLQPQLRILVCVAFLAALWPLYGAQLVPDPAHHTPADMAFALVWVLGAACALGTAYQAKFHRLAALILMGGAGLMTCVTFAWLSAPDLALTQLLVEIVTTVLILLGLRWLPKRREEVAPRTRTSGARFRVRSPAISPSSPASPTRSSAS
jgi:multicomponent K+:H+ antiporter subunit A